MALSCKGIAMYDARDSIKVEAAEAIGLGYSVYIHTDGKAYVVDNGKSDVCHGWALKAAAAGTEVTIVQRCRMWINTTFTIGVRVYTGAVAGGSAPTTSGGIIVGYAWKTDEVMLRAPTPAADG